MKSLYQIIKEIQNASGSNAKIAILEANKNNELLKAYLKAVYDPAISYYQTKTDIVETDAEESLDTWSLTDMQTMLAQRTLTGDRAKDWLKKFMQAYNKQSQELIQLLIKRSIGAGVGDTMILKVFPDLYFIPSYQRCSLMDEKAKAKFSNLSTFIVQRKEDGSFCYLVKEAGKAPEAITRSGSKYPVEFATKLAEGLPDGFVVVGELLVEEAGVELDRKTGNGILNSVLKGGEVSDKLSFKLSAWDCITPEELKAGESKTPYEQRLKNLDWAWSTIVPTFYVKTLEEAYAINSNFTAQGKEGSVLKTTNFLWKNGTSKDCIKLKVEFEVDLKVIGMTEGTGKASGMMGSLTVASSDGLLVSDVGTGFSDEQRKVWWSMYSSNTIEDMEIIITVKANDIISKRDSEKVSLFLPVFLEERLDKTEADSYTRCVVQWEAAKG